MPFQGQRKWHILIASYGGDTEWAIELLYNSVKTGRQLVLRPVWRPDPLLTRCDRESQHPGGWAPRPPVEHLVERERTTDGHKSGGQYIAVLFGLQLPLTHTTLSNKVRGIFF